MLVEELMPLLSRVRFLPSEIVGMISEYVVEDYARRNARLATEEGALNGLYARQIALNKKVYATLFQYEGIAYLKTLRNIDSEPADNSPRPNERVIFDPEDYKGSRRVQVRFAMDCWGVRGVVFWILQPAVMQSAQHGPLATQLFRSEGDDSRAPHVYWESHDVPTARRKKIPFFTVKSDGHRIRGLGPWRKNISNLLAEAWDL
ncbi:hypothetical protein B0T21DRAFT_412847 [Apiosordaria backusii]|uniref:Uncharacterized protein n=1 Tax=Apiosordaria backusii TaxID=314023 RepID=A0AA40ECS7_9PEZI|nr:hypothetical protein B0T21DRAFT_412847 [Apiosordaria backusii]